MGEDRRCRDPLDPTEDANTKVRPEHGEKLGEESFCSGNAEFGEKSDDCDPNDEKPVKDRPEGASCLYK